MSRVPSDRAIAAASLDIDVSDGKVHTLADGVSDSVAIGSGHFGNVGTYRYHGAAVAVKVLKAGADAESIGMSRFDPSTRHTAMGGISTPCCTCQL